MEMKELCKTLLATFGVENVGELSVKIGDAILSGKADIYEKYLALCPDLETDYMRQIWEYYEADRDEKKQDYTPACLGELLSDLIGNGGSVVYDCCAGSGSLTIQRWVKDKGAVFICEELDERVIPLLLFNLAVRNIGGYAIHGNALEQKRFGVFELTPTEKYSKITKVSKVNIAADCGISNPPYNIAWTPPSGNGLFADERFAELGTPPKSNANYAFILHVLSKVKRRAALILPCSVLNSSHDDSVRKAIIDKGLLSAVIMLPDSLFINTSIATCILLFDKTTENDRVVFIDARELHGVEVRKQRGEGDVHYHRVYNKNVRVLKREQIDKILECIAEKRRKIELYATVHTAQIKESDYSIEPRRWIEYINRRELHRPLKDIVKDINRCYKDKNIIKVTINETTAKMLGLYEVAELAEQGRKITDKMNNDPIMKRLGFAFERENYITLTKSAEIKIEKQSKDDASHLLGLFLYEFRNHIYYLNERSNEYLAELRDAMAYELLSGGIDVVM